MDSKVEAPLGDHRAELQSRVLASEQLLLPAPGVGVARKDGRNRPGK